MKVHGPKPHIQDALGQKPITLFKNYFKLGFFFPIIVLLLDINEIKS